MFAHPVYGASFEGFIIENILVQLPHWQASYFRSSNGAEADLVLEKGGQTVAIEIKSSTSPKLSKGNWSAFDVLRPDQCYVVAPVDCTYSLGKNVMAMTIDGVIEEISSL
ncbi:hypothetical protein MMIC_P0766 [Mariprofundus micogutta]|uniref:DUF4143 domain-containing protein n=1 Tax=Mariprofundus micogutta TaxID=1921010 RepID=A0A1L8CLL4_9PROT|nr:DUF4143 domain-containing protein [Mariprofundus micogutta]GAV19808.1 hypothetical protein MMIC_P0766 [Mariprofundus micogutta]